MAFRRDLRQFIDDNRNLIIGLEGFSPALLDALGAQDRRFIQKQLDIQKLAGELAQNLEAFLTRVWSETYFSVPKSFVREHFWFQPHLLLPIVVLKFIISLHQHFYGWIHVSRDHRGYSE